jgi:hypothetical protein
MRILNRIKNRQHRTNNREFARLSKQWWAKVCSTERFIQVSYFWWDAD